MVGGRDVSCAECTGGRIGTGRVQSKALTLRREERETAQRILYYRGLRNRKLVKGELLHLWILVNIFGKTCIFV